MRSPSPLPPELGRVFGTATATRAGVSPKRLRASDLTTPFNGARSLRAPPSDSDKFESSRRELVQRCLAFSAVAPSEFCFSGITAAALYGIPIPPRLTSITRIDVSVPAVQTPPRRRGVRGHRVKSWQIRHSQGMPLIAPAVAWAQLSMLLTLDELVIAGDYLVRRKRPISTVKELTAAARSVRRGGRRARLALLDVRAGTDSPPESETRLVLVRGGLPEPLVGFTVFHDGYFVGTPDLAYVAEKIAIEYQGSVHWLDRRVFEEDIIRRELFERAGWKVVLITATRLRNPARLVADVGVLLRERG